MGDSEGITARPSETQPLSHGYCRRHFLVSTPRQPMAQPARGALPQVAVGLLLIQQVESGRHA